jgi:hypothetical protein
MPGKTPLRSKRGRGGLIGEGSLGRTHRGSHAEGGPCRGWRSKSVSEVDGRVRFCERSGGEQPQPSFEDLHQGP